MAEYRIGEAARLLGVSDDTLRRWVDGGRVEASTDAAGRRVVDGVALAGLAQQLARAPQDDPHASSARNRFVGLVTAMAQVDLQCGPFRVVSLMSSEAVRDLGLEVGATAVAVVKATTVIVEKERPR